MSIELNGTVTMTEGEMQEVCVSVGEQREREIGLSLLILPGSGTLGMLVSNPECFINSNH